MKITLLIFEHITYLNEPGKNNLAGDELKFFVKKGTDIKSYISSLPLKSPFKKKDLSLIISEVNALMSGVTQNQLIIFHIGFTILPFVLFLATFLIKNAAGGVLITKSKLLSS